MDKEGDLRVWWSPQVPMKPFHQTVPSVDAGILLLDALARYDQFQLENDIKPDYANVGGLEVFEGGEWCEWSHQETGDNIDEYMAVKAA